MLKKLFALFPLFLISILPACRSADSSPVTVRLGGHMFSIPRNYLRAWEDESTTTSGKINIEVLLPGFNPYDGQNGAEFGVKKNRTLTINIHPLDSGTAKPTGKYSIDLTPWLDRELSGAKHQSRNFGAPETTDFGLTKYPSREPGTSAGDLYARTEDGRVRFVLRCNRAEELPSPYCRSLRPILGTLDLYYRYPIEFLPAAIQIDREIQTLITSFQTEGESQ